jgi:hypothetical protein
MKDMDKTVSRIEQNGDNQERISFWGLDVDGTTPRFPTRIFHLKLVLSEVAHYIPRSR